MRKGLVGVAKSKKQIQQKENRIFKGAALHLSRIKTQYGQTLSGVPSNRLLCVQSKGRHISAAGSNTDSEPHKEDLHPCKICTEVLIHSLTEAITNHVG